MIAELMPYPAMKDSGIEWLREVPEHWRGAAGKLTEYRHPINGYRLFKQRDLDVLLKQVQQSNNIVRNKPR